MWARTREIAVAIYAREIDARGRFSTVRPPCRPTICDFPIRFRPNFGGEAFGRLLKKNFR